MRRLEIQTLEFLIAHDPDPVSFRRRGDPGSSGSANTAMRLAEHGLVDSFFHGCGTARTFKITDAGRNALKAKAFV